MAEVVCSNVQGTRIPTGSNSLGYLETAFVIAPASNTAAWGADISTEPDTPHTDSDGDLIVPRRSVQHFDAVAGCIAEQGNILRISHMLATPVASVGLQVWNGSLLLADFFLHQAAALSGCKALELGAGPGLAGLVLARVASRVFLTDVGQDILDNCQVRELDWFRPEAHLARASSAAATQVHNSSPYQWTAKDLGELEDVQVFLAGDVIYDDGLTDAFMGCVAELMTRPAGNGVTVNRRLYLTLEKRFNFELRHLDVRAHANDHFRSFFQDTTDSSSGAARRQEAPPKLLGRKWDLSQIPQRLKYERSTDLELWELHVPTSIQPA